MAIFDRTGGYEAEDSPCSFLSVTESDPLQKMAAQFTSEAPAPKLPMLLAVFGCLSIGATSYFSCNLALEMAKRNQTVSVIDFDLKGPNVRHLMGNLVDLQDTFPKENRYHLDFKIEHIKLHKFSDLTLISLARSGEQVTARKILDRIFADQRVRRSEIVLISLPAGPDDLPLSDPFTYFHKALFLIDSQINSLLLAYSWIKKLSPICQKHLIGAVSLQSEETGGSRQNTAKLGKIVPKYLPVDLEILTTDIPLDQEAMHSVKSRRPLALVGSPSASGQAISILCEDLLRDT